MGRKRGKKRTKGKNPQKPRRYNLGRPKRLREAKAWVEKNRGPRVFHRYRKHYRVDALCAVRELLLLGVELDPQLVERVEEEAKSPQKRRAEARAREPLDPRGEYGVDWDETFAFIAGFTSGGFPYGTTWEEQEAMERAAAQEWLDTRPGDRLPEGEAEELQGRSPSEDPFVDPEQHAAANGSIPERDDEIPF